LTVCFNETSDVFVDEEDPDIDYKFQCNEGATKLIASAAAALALAMMQ